MAECSWSAQHSMLPMRKSLVGRDRVETTRCRWSSCIARWRCSCLKPIVSADRRVQFCCAGLILSFYTAWAESGSCPYGDCIVQVYTVSNGAAYSNVSLIFPFDLFDCFEDGYFTRHAILFYRSGRPVRERVCFSRALDNELPNNTIHMAHVRPKVAYPLI